MLNVPSQESKLKKAGFIIMAVTACLVGLYPLIYFNMNRNFGLLQSKTDTLIASPVWRTAFIMHISCGGIALLCGWSQFSGSLKKKYSLQHRRLGLSYVIFCCLSGMAATYISFYATGGFIPATGFFCLAMVWMSTTIAAFIQIKNRRVEAHQRMMTYSYAACLAAVTLRIYLPILPALMGDFVKAYSIIAWLCWVPNMFVAWWINKNRKPLAAKLHLHG